MDQFEQFMKKYQCSKCQTRYYDGRYKYSCRCCTAHVCEPCGQGGYDYCQTCHVYMDSAAVRIDFDEIHQLVYAPSKKCAEVEQENEKLKTENSLVKEKQEKFEKENSLLKRKQEEYELSREDHHKCSECTTSESEQNMQLCATCDKIESTNIVEHVLCASCAIKKHIRKGHQTVDFYPYLRAAKYNSHSVEFTSASDNLKNSRDLLNMTVKKFNDLSENVSENFNTLTEMARRSNSTKNQVEFFEKITAFVNESNLIHVDADDDLKKRLDVLEKNLENIKKWYEERAGNCVDDSETIKDI